MSADKTDRLIEWLFIVNLYPETVFCSFAFY